MFKRGWTFLLGLLLISIPAYTQQYQKESIGYGISPTPIFKTYNNSSGLPDQRIRNIFQDSRGYLWVATMNGLCRFDGYNFVKFSKKNNQGNIAANWAFTMAEDAKHNIWFGTAAGLSKFDSDTETFINFDVPGRMPYVNTRVSSLQFDKHDVLWIGTSAGLSRFDQKTNKITIFNTAPFNTGILKIIDGDNNWLWMTSPEGVIHFNTVTKEHEFYKINTKTNPYGDKFWAMAQIGKDLYIGTGGDGLIKLTYNAETSKFKPYEYVNDFKNGSSSLQNIQIFDICQSETGDVWLATEHGLAKITHINSAAPVLIFNRHNPVNSKSISSNIVYKVIIDKNGVLWSGTEAGLNKLDLNLLPFQYYTFTNESIKDGVRSIGMAPDGKIWFGTSNTGLFNYSIKNNRLEEVSRSFLNKSNRSLFITDQGVWSGGLNGLAGFDFSGRQITSETTHGNVVYALCKSVTGHLWIGTNKGLYMVKPNGSLANFTAGPMLKNGFIRIIYEDHAGRIWVGLENGGFGFIDPHTLNYYSIVKDPAGNHLFGNIFLSITESPQNVIWAGSESGLNKIILSGEKGPTSVEHIKTYSEENGLPDQSVNSIIPDGNGFLWIGTIKGLVAFNTRNEQFNKFLSDIDFSMSSYQLVNSHQFLFGTSDGFLLFDPSAIKHNSQQPDLYFSDLKLFNRTVNVNSVFNDQVVLHKSIANTRDIELNYQNNVFTIGFIAIHSSNPGQNQYAYKMEGFNKDWIITDAQNRSATYTNLKPGVYYFKVKAANYAGYWTKTTKVLKISILPPPWKTWWAIVLYVILFNILLYLFVHYLLKQHKQRNRLHIEQLEKEQLKNLNQLKVKFFTDVSHEFRTPISLIAGPVEDMLASEDIGPQSKAKMQMVYRNCKKLLYLIDELMTFQKIEQVKLKLNLADGDMVSFLEELYKNFEPLAEKKKLGFSFFSALPRYVLPFDQAKLEMAINNLLINAIKFTKEGGQITIDLDLRTSKELPFKPLTIDQEWLRIAVQDNGKGIDEKSFEHLFERFFSDTEFQGTGVGLSLTKSLVELHNGHIVAQSIPNVRTNFEIYLPVDEAYLDQDSLITGSERYLSEYDRKAVVLLNEAMANTIENSVGKQETILLVDDNPEVLDFLESLLKDKYLIRRAENGTDAILSVGEKEPDLIISDVAMPVMDGVELCRIIKNEVKTSHIPFILLTAKTEVNYQIEGLQIGADDYMGKPFHPHVLKLRVNNLISLQKKMIGRYQSDGIIVPKNITQNPLDEAFLHKVMEAVQTNMSNEDFGVEELSQMVCMSRSHLFRKLKAITGQNPMEVIYSIRLKHAVELLLQRKLSVSQISYEVGFRNHSSFTASFKKQFGKTPSEYLNDILEDVQTQ